MIDVIGDATLPIGEGLKTLCHICNDRGGWGKGFCLQVSRRWPLVEYSYRHWIAELRHNKVDPLGRVLFCPNDDGGPRIYIATMVAQHGYKPTQKGGQPIRYEALRTCLNRVGLDARSTGASIHMPRIGTGLAGGKWTLIAPIIEETLAGLDVYVYTRPA